MDNSCYWLWWLILLSCMLDNLQHHFSTGGLYFSLGEILFNSITCSHVLSLMSSTFYVILIFMKCIMGLYKYQVIHTQKNPLIYYAYRMYGHILMHLSRICFGQRLTNNNFVPFSNQRKNKFWDMILNNLKINPNQYSNSELGHTDFSLVVKIIYTLYILHEICSMRCKK